jgi:DNA-binding NarL/FixJ family response regulator
LIGRTNPDLVLLDIRMPQLDGLSCLERIRARYPDVKVVVLSASNDREQIDQALRRGASGYIVKSVNVADLAAAIRQTIDGTVYHAVGLREESAGETAGLTERELVILRAVSRGLSNQAIGRELWVTEQTVKFHLTNIYRKLGVANRAQAVNYAHQHGLAEPQVV